jgi:hypothetical protein
LISKVFFSRQDEIYAQGESILTACHQTVRLSALGFTIEIVACKFPLAVPLNLLPTTIRQYYLTDFPERDHIS